MQWCSAICFLVAAVGAASTESFTEPSPTLEGLNPSEIEKIMIEQLLAKPKESKEAFDFVKTVKPILDQFKKQMLVDKKKMQQELDSDVAVIKKCIMDMKKATKVALLEIGNQKKNCPSPGTVKKCEEKLKNLGPKKKACKDLEGANKVDHKSAMELVKQWNKQKVLKKDCKIDKGETRYHYVTRLASHFEKKLAAFEKKLEDLIKKDGFGKKLKKGCDEIKHYQRVLKEKTCQELKDAAYGCSCGKVVKEKKVCTTFDQCYAAAVTSKENNEKEIKKKNAAAKLEWRAVGRIECLIKVMSGKKKADAKQLEACVKGPQVSTKPLDLKYHLTPPKPKCALKGVDDKVRKMCEKPKEKKKLKR